MIIGRDENRNTVIHLDPAETTRFKEGQEIVKRSGDHQGMFTVTLKLEYELRSHPWISDATEAMNKVGECLYRGWKITPAAGFGYDYTKVGEPKLFGETINAVLHAIDKQEVQ